jgi:hypothetical protein
MGRTTSLLLDLYEKRVEIPGNKLEGSRVGICTMFEKIYKRVKRNHGETRT